MPASKVQVRRFEKPGFRAAVLLSAVLSILASNPGRAACACICVDGQNRPLCSEVTDIEPICPPKLCPDLPGSTRPLDTQRLPPSGTRDCSMEYVYNAYAQRYEWRQLCQ